MLSGGGRAVRAARCEEKIMVTRREFLDALAVGAAGLAVGTTVKSYGRIVGANDRLNFAVIGLNGRGYAHLSSLKANQSAARISHVCDVDGNILKKFADAVQREMGEAPAAEKDFRAILEQKDVDAITIAIRRWPSRGCRRASTSTWKSRAATIRLRERCWCKRSRNMESSCRWARSSAPRHTASRSWKRLMEA